MTLLLFPSLAQMQRRVEACCRDGTDPNVRLCTVKCITMIARNIRGTPGPAYYKLILSMLDIFAVNLRQLDAAYATGDLRPEGEENTAGKVLSAAEKMKLLQVS